MHLWHCKLMLPAENGTVSAFGNLPGMEGSIQKACTALQGGFREVVMAYSFLQGMCLKTGNLDLKCPLKINIPTSWWLCEGCVIDVISFSEVYQLLLLVRTTSQVCKAEDQFSEPKGSYESHLLVFCLPFLPEESHLQQEGMRPTKKEKQWRVGFLMTLFLDLVVPENSYPLDSSVMATSKSLFLHFCCFSLSSYQLHPKEPWIINSLFLLLSTSSTS